MAEYYPLLAKAIGSLPNSTPESRRVVYERARKALIGQLRTLHPPVPDDDIERESVTLDKAVERLEAELAKGVVPGAPPTPAKAADAPTVPPSAAPPAKPAVPLKEGGVIGPAGQRPVPPLRPPMPRPPVAKLSADRPPVAAKLPAAKPLAEKPPADEQTAGAPGLKPQAPKLPSLRPPVGKAPVFKPQTLEPPGSEAFAADGGEPPLPVETTSPDAAPAATVPADTATRPPPRTATQEQPGDSKRLKPPQRPIAPQPRDAAGPKRRLWIIPVAVGIVAALVAGAAWKLRDRPETLIKNKPAEQTQAETGKIAERVGEPSSSSSAPTDTGTQPTPPSKAPEETGKAVQPAQTAQPTNPNPEVPVAHRAALLVEAPDEPNKVKTFLGTVVWKLNNATQGATEAVGLAVEADVDLPDDKMKAIVTFEKNKDASLPASHTIKVRFMVEPGSFSGNVKQISVPQMRPEASPGGEPLAGVTVPITTNSFLVGLSPGNAEAANTDLLRRLQWIDIPIMLDSGKIAKLTFEKSDSGQRDLNEALEAWAKE